MKHTALRPAVSYLRFSRAEQGLGDSERRQITDTEAYCAANFLKLNDVYFDRGVSGFRGRHRRKGRLADLIEAARANKFAPGTALVVESLDRLSREEVRVALQQFLELINEHALEIHAIGDKPPQVYRQENLDLGSLVISIISMGRAHGESARKSDLITASWKGLRLRGKATSQPGKKPMGRHPSWLEWNVDRWVVIEERATLLRYIFDDLILRRRLGRYEIARTLIEENAVYWGKSEGWTAMGVKRYITNPALVGRLEPTKSTDPDAATVEGYYPAIIDLGAYEEVQKLIEARRSKGGRPRTEHELALLTGLSQVEGKALHRGYANQPSGKHQLTYAYVDAKSRNRYFAMGDILEGAVVRGLMLISVKDLHVDDSAVKNLRSRRALLVENRMKKDQAVTNFVAAIGSSSGEDVLDLTRALNGVRAERSEITRKIDSIDAEMAMSGTGASIEESWLRIGQLLDKALVEKDPLSRQEVKTLLSRLVKSIELGRLDKEDWWKSFPEWSRAHLDYFSSFTNRDPEDNVGYIDDEEQGTPPPLKPAEKIIAAIEFWSGARFLLRDQVVLPV